MWTFALQPISRRLNAEFDWQREREKIYFLANVPSVGVSLSILSRRTYQRLLVPTNEFIGNFVWRTKIESGFIEILLLNCNKSFVRSFSGMSKVRDVQRVWEKSALLWSWLQFPPRTKCWTFRKFCEFVPWDDFEIHFESSRILFSSKKRSLMIKIGTQFAVCVKLRFGFESRVKWDLIHQIWAVSKNLRVK